MYGSSVEAGFGHCVVKHREKFSWDPHVTDTCMGYLTRALAARDSCKVHARLSIHCNVDLQMCVCTIYSHNGCKKGLEKFEILEDMQDQKAFKMIVRYCCKKRIFVC